MTRWSYLVAHMEAGMMVVNWPDDQPGKQSLQGGLTYLGSQGWELVTIMQHSSLGTTGGKADMIFKKPTDDYS